MFQTVLNFYQTEVRFSSKGPRGTLLKLILVKSVYIESGWMLFPFMLKSNLLMTFKYFKLVVK